MVLEPIPPIQGFLVWSQDYVICMSWHTLSLNYWFQKIQICWVCSFCSLGVFKKGISKIQTLMCAGVEVKITSLNPKSRTLPAKVCHLASLSLYDWRLLFMVWEEFYRPSIVFKAMSVHDYWIQRRTTWHLQFTVNLMLAPTPQAFDEFQNH